MTTILDGNNYVTREELKRIQRGTYTAVWHNPVDGIIYGGETVKNGVAVPTYEDAIFDTNVAKEAKALKDAGKLDRDELPYKGWIGEHLDTFTERLGVKSAAVMTNAQFSAIDTTTVLNRLLGTEVRDFTIPDAVTTIPTNGLEYQIDVYTRFNISLNVPEGVAAYTKRGSVATTSFDLVKDVGHIAATDEMVMKSRQNLYASSITNIASDFRRAKSAKIADVLEGASETNVGDWDAFTSGLSDANPLEHLRARFAAIVANNGHANTVVSTDVGFTAFTGNTNVRGAYNNQRAGVDSEARSVMVDLLPKVTNGWFIDNELASASVIVMDKEAVVNVQGPTRVGQYRKEAEGIDGYIARDWYQCQIVQSGKIAELTTVTT